MLLSTRTTPAKKAQFTALASSQRLSESALLSLLIDQLLDQNPVPATPAMDDDTPATERISLRLRPGDRQRLEQRAEARDMKLASYIVMLLRAHVRRDPPMPMAELAELKVAVGEVSAIGRNLNQLTRLAHSGSAGIDASLRSLLKDAQRQVEDVRRAVADVVRVHLTSWESEDA